MKWLQRIALTCMVIATNLWACEKCSVIGVARKVQAVKGHGFKGMEATARTRANAIFSFKNLVLRPYPILCPHRVSIGTPSQVPGVGMKRSSGYTYQFQTGLSHLTLRPRGREVPVLAPLPPCAIQPIQLTYSFITKIPG
jgi:hypothetical protein